MLEFQEIKIEDKIWMDPILRQSGLMGYDGAFGTRFIWSGAYHSKYCKYQDYLIFASGKDKLSYSFPLGQGDLGGTIQAMLQDAEERGNSFSIRGLTAEQKDELEQACPETFEFWSDRDSADYIYLSQDLIQLAGRKFHSKRNHLSKFARMYDFTYEEVTAQNLGECEKIAREWCSQNGNCGENGLDKETCALKKSFTFFDALKFSGGLIRIDGKPVAFTIGEEINERAFLLHFEKALSGYDGLYAAINHEFACHSLENYEYVNREEDMGLEGLRKAKLSYYPAIILERFSAHLKGCD